MDSSTVICWASPFVPCGPCRIYSVHFIIFLMQNPVSNVGPDQMQHYVASDQGLHGLPMALYGFPGKNRLNI